MFLHEDIFACFISVTCGNCRLPGHLIRGTCEQVHEESVLKNAFYECFEIGGVNGGLSCKRPQCTQLRPWQLSLCLKVAGSSSLRGCPSTRSIELPTCCINIISDDVYYNGHLF